MSLPDKLNGLSTSEFPPIAFIDLDGVVFEEGTIEFMPRALENLREVLYRGWKPCFFSAGLSEERLRLLYSALGDTFSWLAKPLASAYCFVDDRLTVDACDTSLMSWMHGPANCHPMASDAWEGK